MSKPISSPPQSEPQPGSERVLPLHTPGTASLLLAACIATIAWLSLAAQTDITVHRMLARGFSVFDGIERLLKLAPPADEAGHWQPWRLRFSPQAYDAWKFFQRAIEILMREGNKLYWDPATEQILDHPPA